MLLLLSVCVFGAPPFLERWGLVGSDNIGCNGTLTLVDGHPNPVEIHAPAYTSDAVVWQAVYDLVLDGAFVDVIKTDILYTVRVCNSVGPVAYTNTLYKKCTVATTDAGVCYTAETSDSTCVAGGTWCHQGTFWTVSNYTRDPLPVGPIVPELSSVLEQGIAAVNEVTCLCDGYRMPFWADEVVAGYRSTTQSPTLTTTATPTTAAPTTAPSPPPPLLYNASVPLSAEQCANGDFGICIGSGVVYCTDAAVGCTQTIPCATTIVPTVANTFGCGDSNGYTRVTPQQCINTYDLTGNAGAFGVCIEGGEVITEYCSTDPTCIYTHVCLNHSVHACTAPIVPTASPVSAPTFNAPTHAPQTTPTTSAVYVRGFWPVDQQNVGYLWLATGDGPIVSEQAPNVYSATGVQFAPNAAKCENEAGCASATGQWACVRMLYTAYPANAPILVQTQSDVFDQRDCRGMWIRTVYISRIVAIPRLIDVIYDEYALDDNPEFALSVMWTPWINGTLVTQGCSPALVWYPTVAAWIDTLASPERLFIEATRIPLTFGPLNAIVFNSTIDSFSMGWVYYRLVLYHAYQDALTACTSHPYHGLTLVMQNHSLESCSDACGGVDSCHVVASNADCIATPLCEPCNTSSPTHAAFNNITFSPVSTGTQGTRVHNVTMSATVAAILILLFLVIVAIVIYRRNATLHSVSQ